MGNFSLQCSRSLLDGMMKCASNILIKYISTRRLLVQDHVDNASQQLDEACRKLHSASNQLQGRSPPTLLRDLREAAQRKVNRRSRWHSAALNPKLHRLCNYSKYMCSISWKISTLSGCVYSPAHVKALKYSSGFGKNYHTKKICKFAQKMNLYTKSKHLNLQFDFSSYLKYSMNCLFYFSKIKNVTPIIITWNIW